MIDYSDADREQSQKKVLVSIRKKNGCTRKWLEVESYLEGNSLAIVIHQLIQLGQIYKKDNLFYITDMEIVIPVVKPITPAVSHKEVTECISEALKTKNVRVDEYMYDDEIGPGPVNTEMVRKPISPPPLVNKTTIKGPVLPVVTVTPVIDTVIPLQTEIASPIIIEDPIQTPERIFGNYYRGSAVGLLAYFFYTKRKENTAFNLDDLYKELEDTNVDAKYISNSIWKLNAEGIITVVNPEAVRNKRKFKWSGKLIYPFKKEHHDDCSLILKKLVYKNNWTADPIKELPVPDTFKEIQPINEVCEKNVIEESKIIQTTIHPPIPELITVVQSKTFEDHSMVKVPKKEHTFLLHTIKNKIAVAEYELEILKATRDALETC